MAGWYRMHRGWMDHEIFSGDAFSRRDAFQWMIQEAAFRDATINVQGKPLQLRRGQFTHSIRFMAKAWKWDEKRVRRFLAMAETWQIIAAESAAGQTVVTICNYEKYQTQQEVPAAPAAADAPQERRGGAAEKKKERNKEEEEVSRVPARGRQARYAFAGETIRLNDADLDRWRTTYSAIPDLIAELTSIDAWWRAQPDEKRKGWFHATAGMLNRRHQEQLSAQRVADARAPTTVNPDGSIADVHSFVDAFLARVDAPPRAPLPTRLKFVE